jgi:hypothetical protein
MMTRLEKVRQFQNMFIACAEGLSTNFSSNSLARIGAGAPCDEDYNQLRLVLLKDSQVRELLPELSKVATNFINFGVLSNPNLRLTKNGGNLYGVSSPL